MAIDRLADDLVRERDGFLEELAAVAPESMTTPGLVGEWSARELVAHLGYWVGYATEAIHAVEQGRAAELDPRALDVEQVDATVARVARGTDPETVRRREAASVQALVERLRTVDDGLLAVVLPDGRTLEAVVRDHGPDHYREHAAELRAIVQERPRG